MFNIMFLYWIKQSEQKENVCCPVNVQGYRGWWPAEEHNSPTVVGNKIFSRPRQGTWFSVQHTFALGLSHLYSKCPLEGSRPHTTKLRRQTPAEMWGLSSIRLSKLLFSRISTSVCLSQTAFWVLILYRTYRAWCQIQFIITTLRVLKCEHNNCVHISVHVSLIFYLICLPRAVRFWTTCNLCGFIRRLFRRILRTVVWGISKQPAARTWIKWMQPLAVRVHMYRGLYTCIMLHYTHTVYIYYVCICVKCAFVRTTKSALWLSNAVCNIAQYILHVHTLCPEKMLGKGLLMSREQNAGRY